MKQFFAFCGIFTNFELQPKIMRKFTLILFVLLLLGSCKKEANCISDSGTVEIYSNYYGGVTVIGDDGKFNYMLNGKAFVRFDKPKGVYYLAYYNNTNVFVKDTVEVKGCETVKLTY